MKDDMEMKILDTNVLLDYPHIVTKQDQYYLIPMCVLREIDDLKKSPSQEVAKKARKAAVYISKNMDNIEFRTEDPENTSADNQLLALAKEEDAILVTNDVSLKVKANVLGIKTEGYSWDGDYTGIYYLDIENMSKEIYESILAELYETGTYEREDYTFSYNEYLIIPAFDNKDDPPCIFKYNGKKFEPVYARDIETNKEYLVRGDKIKPRNAEQICLFDAILNSQNKILYVGGPFGTGKTFSTHHYAIHQLEKAAQKIIYIPNNSQTQDSMDLGALPGDLFEKIQPLIGPLIDIVGINQVQQWIENGDVEIVPISYIRGRNFTNSIVIVSEAENLTEEHIKLLIGRCGEGTRIFFDGDIHQADSAIFKDRNGLKLLLKLHESEQYSRIFATIQLVKIERSEVAAAADYLDKL